MPKKYIGVSGWTFPGWRGVFYPKGLVQKKELSYASRQLNSIEINGTFYSLQKPESFQRWYDDVPENFCFSVKAPQYITHIRRLKEVGEPLANFFASGLLCLNDKLGPILWQFPPNVMLKDDRFEKFLKLLPRDSKSASRLAKKHSQKVEGRNFTDALSDFEIRHAFEFRHPSFDNPEFIDLLQKNKVAFVMAHAGLKSPWVEVPTADFIYARMHGQGPKYKKGYPLPVLKEFAERLETLAAKRDAYIYFDTDEKKYAPADAANLSKLLDSRR